MELLSLAIPVTVAGAAIALQLWNRARWAAAVSRVARELGLEYTEPRWHHRAHAFGSVEDKIVTIKLVTVGSGKNRHVEMLIIVDARGAFEGLRLARESLALRFLNNVLPTAPPVLAADIVVGSEEFDRLIRVNGMASEAEAVSRLNHAARAAAMVAIVEYGAKLGAGTLELQTRRVAYDAGDLRAQVGALIALSKALSEQSSTVPRRLADNAMRDPESPVRARNLGLLISEYGQSAEAREAVAHAMSDRSPEVRVLAARAMGDEGARELLTIAFDAGCRRKERVRALETLGARFLNWEAARGRAVSAQAYLISRLEDDDEELVAMAARALGWFATLEAVEPLARHTRGITTGRAVKDASAAAIAQIQARHAGEAGRLSLAPSGGGGEVSLASSAGAGALSPVEGSIARGDRES